MSGEVMSEVELITVGRILRPFGVHGQVRVQSLTDVPGRLEGLKDVTLVLPTGQQVGTTITHVHRDGRSYLLKCTAFSTPEEAKAFGGARLTIPQGPVPPPPEGHWWQFELIGLTVMDQRGVVLGVIEDVLEFPEQHLLVVRREENEILIPASRRWVTNVDIEGKVMTVVHPEEWGETDAV